MQWSAKVLGLVKAGVLESATARPPELAPSPHGHGITTAPEVAPADCHWYCPIWLLSEPFEVSEGNEFELCYRHTLVTTTLECRARLRCGYGDPGTET